MFVKESMNGSLHEVDTACDRNGMVLAVEVTAGNVSDSVAWDAVYNKVTGEAASLHEAQFVVMDAGYKTPWIAKEY
ncbi:MAG: transposase [Oscillospiraceae bacterium]